LICSKQNSRLFKAAETPSAVRVWERKRLGVAKNGRKETVYLNQGVNDVIQAKKIVCKALLQDKFYLDSRCAEALKFAALTVKKSKIEYWEYFGHTLDSN